ncbi:PAS domain S-box protein [Phaeovulum vinaykumarii]|uniref:histidine kinase n=1 Tax=Phaeovulum vinaykumarii TaxID=407234 RepID=A0A1N7K293_9RHOB|nr:PAS domain S-box protein [Phaeovulum vinaykumarii]SIS55709.1 PAS domain S-box-containing protein [Phaeovulum vinaykumarii]SOB92509.1 PAS domain S-box-containing protein [Phaeovulum vinaykumarii]
MKTSDPRDDRDGTRQGLAVPPPGDDHGPGVAGDGAAEKTLGTETLGALDMAGLRQEARLARRERGLLFDLLDAMADAPSPESAVETLIAAVARALEADAVVFACMRPRAEGLIVQETTDPRLRGMVWREVSFLAADPQRVDDLRARRWPAPPPTPLAGYHAMIAAPVGTAGARPFALICLSRNVAHFDAEDARTLQSVARLATQVLAARTLARRNTALARLVRGNLPPPGDDLPDVPGLDQPFVALNRAYDRLTRAQEVVVEIIDELLRAPLDQADAAIDRALARLGRYCEADRAYVFRQRPDAPLLDNSHEWVAEGIAPMIDELQGVPSDLTASWMAAFAREDPVQITDVSAMPDDAPEKEILQMQGIRSLLAVPMREQGRFAGFVGYDMVRRHHVFLPGEVHLLKSVANVIGTILSRAAAEAEIARAQVALVAERQRLRATLDAMPDLVLELGPDGRFSSVHAGLGQTLDVPAEQLLCRRPAEVFGPAMARFVREVVREVDANGFSTGRQCRLTIEGKARIFSVSAAARRGEGVGGAPGYLLVARDITEDYARRQELERLSRIARNTTNLVVVTDAERRIEWVNNAFVDRTGYSLDEVRGQRPGSFLQCPQTDPATIDKLRRALDEGQPVQAEILNRAKDGVDYWLDVKIEPLIDEAGTLQGFMAVQTDITPLKEQQAALQLAAADAEAARARLFAAVEAMPDAFACFDAENRLVLANSRFHENHRSAAALIAEGCARADILRALIEAGEYPDAIGREGEWMAQRALEQARPECEREQPLADGRWLRIIEKAIPDGGRVILEVDITSMKQAAERALADRAAAMDSTLDGIALTDAEGCYLYMNRAHLEMFAIPSEAEILGKPWTVLYMPEQAEQIRAKVFDVLARDGAWQGETVGRRFDGTEFPQEVSLTLREDGGLICITRDITERLREEREQLRLREELQVAQRREIIGQLAAGLAHDFNNLLAAISGSASLILETPPDEAPDLARRIVSATEQAAVLVRRLMDLGARRSRRSRIDMRVPLREAAELVRAGQRGRIALDLDLPERPLEAEADPTDVLQVVLNLAINARDAIAMARDLPRREIRLALAEATPDQLSGRTLARGTLDPARRYLRYVVTDTGPGMEEAALARIFQPYYSTKGAAGTGLGLAIVSSVVADNGGAVALSSTPGTGTTFEVFWPVHAEDGGVAQSGPRGGAGASGQAPAVTLSDPAPSGPGSSETGPAGPAPSDPASPDPASAGPAPLVTGRADPPAARPAPDPAPAAAPGADAEPRMGGIRALPGLCCSLRGRLILVVEDSEPVLRVLTAFLEQAGAEVAPCADPRDALAAIEDDPEGWDLLITDFDMPHLNGGELATRAHEYAPRLPVLLVTALPDWRGRTGAAARQFIGVLGKPLTRQSLIESTLAALGCEPGTEIGG